MRNYFEQPLKRGEVIPYDDLYQKYILENLTVSECIVVFNISKSVLARNIRIHKFVKTKEQQRLSIENMYMRKYGVKNPAQLQSSKDKMKKTMFERYGTDNAMKNKDIQKKAKQTCIEKYGVDNPAKVKQVQEKIQKTNLKKYGTKSPLQNKEVKAKIDKTMIEKYGGKHAFQSKELRNKIEQTMIEKYGVKNPMHNNKLKEKQKQTNLTKYGVENVMFNPEIVNKVKQTCLEKYNTDCVLTRPETKKRLEEVYLKRYEVKNPIQSPEILEKSRKTLHDNESFGKSKEKDFIYEKLCELFDKVERQYYCDRYPFACDFYIPSIDLFIEYQGDTSHGKAPFDESNPEHIKLLEKWKKKAQEVNYKGILKTQYKNWIETWTVVDPIKRLIAFENKLNMIEFFSLKEFNNWYKKEVLKKISIYKI